MMVAMTTKRKRELVEHVSRIKKAWKRYKALSEGRIPETSLMRFDMTRMQKIIDIRSRIREITLYCFFLLFFTLSSVWVVQDQDIYHFGNDIRGQIEYVEFKVEHAHVLKTFDDVAVTTEFWQFVQGPLVDFLYTGSSMTGSSDSHKPGFVYWESKIVGAIRFSQVRVKKRDCIESPNFASGTLHCSGGVDGKYTKKTEDKEPFGGPNGDMWTWAGSGDNAKLHQSVDEERSWFLSDFRTNQGRVYPVGSYPVLLPNHNKEKALQVIDDMMNNSYVDEFSKHVHIDITFYNPNIEMFVAVRASVEAGKTGGLRPSFHYATTRLYGMFEKNDAVTITLEVIVILFYAYYISREVMKGCKDGLKHFANGEVLLHNLNLACYLMVWIFRILSSVATPKAEDVHLESDTFYVYTIPTMYNRISAYANSLNAFLCWFKLVVFLGYIPRFALVTGTLSRSARGISGFAVIFVVLFYGFAAAHMMTFGRQVYGYRNLQTSMLTLIKSLLGDFDLDEMERAQFIFGPFFFVLFTAVAVFVVLNILIAIISDAYTDEVKALEDSEDVLVLDEAAHYLHDVCRTHPLTRRFYPRILRYYRRSTARARQANRRIRERLSKQLSSENSPKHKLGRGSTEGVKVHPIESAGAGEGIGANGDSSAPAATVAAHATVEVDTKQDAPSTAAAAVATGGIPAASPARRGGGVEDDDRSQGSKELEAELDTLLHSTDGSPAPSKTNP